MREREVGIRHVLSSWGVDCVWVVCACVCVCVKEWETERLVTFLLCDFRSIDNVLFFFSVNIFKGNILCLGLSTISVNSHFLEIHRNWYCLPFSFVIWNCLMLSIGNIYCRELSWIAKWQHINYFKFWKFQRFVIEVVNILEKKFKS